MLATRELLPPVQILRWGGRRVIDCSFGVGQGNENRVGSADGPPGVELNSTGVRVGQH